MQVRAAALAAVLAGFADVASANLPPVAVASANPTEATVGATIQFSSAGSYDPDAGPAPLAFAWDFDDAGPPSALPDPPHVFAAPGLYRVTLTISDGADTAVALVKVVLLAPPTPGPPSRSGPLALDRTRAELWAVNEDSGSVSCVSTASLAVLAEVPVGAGPRAAALTLDAQRLLVTDPARDALAVLDVATRSVQSTLPVCHGPEGVAVAPVTGKVVLVCADDAAVWILDGSTLAVRAVLAVGDSPHAVAITFDGSRALVTHFLTRGATAAATLVDLAAERVERVVALVPDPGPDTPSSGRGYPNLLGEVAIDPSGTFAWIGGLKSNTDRGLFRSGVPLVPTNRVRGLIAPIDLGAGTEALLRRVDLNNADSATGLGFSSNGRYLYAVHQGTGEVTAYDLPEVARLNPGDGSPAPFTRRLFVGEAPRGLAVDGTRGYVLGFLDRSLHVLDLTQPASPALVASVTLVATEPLSPSVLNGKKMFYGSAAPVHSEGGYIACASCHPGGRSDGRTWDFTQASEGLRNTIDLRGRAGTAMGPVHWSANFDEIQDFENDIVNAFGGTGLAQDGRPPNPPLGAANAGRSRDLDDLAAFVASLGAAPRSPFRGPGGALTPAAARGREVFYRATTRCSACHVPPLFTLSALPPAAFAFRLFDVGTMVAGSGGRLGGPLPGLDVPTLKGAWDTAPYLHAGQAATLRDVLTTANPSDRHGVTTALTPGELDDLVEFLRELDESADTLPSALPLALPGEVSPPGSPVPLLAVKRGGAVVLTWGFEPRADFYRLVRGEIGLWASHTADASSGAGACDAGSSRSFTDPDDLSDGRSDYYLVAAVNAAGEGTYGSGRAPRIPSGDCP